MEYLFTVENTFLITDRGLVLTAGSRENKWTKSGDNIQLILPDKSIINTKVKGVQLFHENWAILIEKDVKKEDVPIGTEVWRCD